MLIELLGKFWRRLPKQFRRWGVLLTESRFTVTVGAVVSDQAGRILLLQHRFRPGQQAGGGWGIPGGFVKTGEQPEAAIRRELREEIGLEVENLELAFARALERYQQIELIFCCSAKTEVQTESREISRAEWFTPDDLPPGLSDDQRNLIERAVR